MMPMSDQLTTLFAILTGGAFAVYVIARLGVRANGVLAALTTGVYAVAWIPLGMLWGEVRSGSYPIWRAEVGGPAILLADPGALLMSALSLGLGLLVAIYSGHYVSQDGRREYYYPLLLALSAGTIGMCLAIDLFTLYLFTLLTNCTAYVLVAFRRDTETSIEAGFKYTIMGSVGSILILTGIGHVYRETASLALPIAEQLGWLYRLGVAMIVAGYAIKSAIVPAHTWLPDAHGRAPSSISALLSGIVIESNLYVLVKMGLGLGWPTQVFGWMLVALALANMTVGNVLALVQVYGKRLLGYSSIAQSGYILLAYGLGLALGRPEAIAAGFFIVMGHAVLKSLAFLCKGACHLYCDATLLEDLRGIAGRLPFVSACFILSLAGLAGVPLLPGLIGKWQILQSSVPQAPFAVWAALLVFLANSVLSLGYYLRVIGLIAKPSALPQEKIPVSPWMLGPIAAFAVIAVAMGVFPQLVIEVTEQAASFLLAWGR